MTTTSNYFVTCHHNGGYCMMAGPFATHAEALRVVPMVKRAAAEAQPEADFLPWGTAHVPERTRPALPFQRYGWAGERQADRAARETFGTMLRCLAHGNANAATYYARMVARGGADTADIVDAQAVLDVVEAARASGSGDGDLIRVIGEPGRPNPDSFTKCRYVATAGDVRTEGYDLSATLWNLASLCGWDEVAPEDRPPSRVVDPVADLLTSDRYGRATS